MKIKLLTILALAVSATAFGAQKKALADYVTTLMGTDNSFEVTRGNMYPSVTVPFGMHAWGAQTGENGSGWKYQYKRDSIRGFQQAHQCSSWTNDYCVFSLMPVTGELQVDQYKRAARFDHKNETAKPYYYSVKFDNGITTELSPTERGAHLRFSFPAKARSWVVLDGYIDISSVRIDPAKRRIYGEVYNSKKWETAPYRNYYVIEFDQSFVSFGTWDNRSGKINPGNLQDGDLGKGAFVEFKKGARVEVRAASSYIGYEQAELNLSRELGGMKKLEDTKEAARQIWNRILGRIEVEGATEEQLATFYSSLFRTMICPRIFYDNDKDGNPYYRSPNDGKIYKGRFYTDTGLWDTFRGQLPFHNLMFIAKQGEYMNSLLAVKEQYGWLPAWSFPREYGGMIGNHAMSLWADAWAKGIRTFDPEKALAAYLHEVTHKGPGRSNGRDGWEHYFVKGYMPYPEVKEATSRTLDAAYNDWCAWTLAKSIGNDFYATIFERQMRNYRNVFNPETGFMQGRKSDGSWLPNFNPIEWGGPFVEGSSWHHTWQVFHDFEGLARLMGGDKALDAKLDELFATPGDFLVGTYRRPIHEMTEMKMLNMGQYAHNNQPAQHIAYLYSYCGTPWKTQQKVRYVMDNLHNSSPAGMWGDDDQGQTTSWYVMSALGFYSVSPGVAQYVIGSPLFRKATVKLESGKTIVIEAENNSPQNVYVQSVTVNGKPITRNYFTYEELVEGAHIRFVMGPNPNTQRGTAESDKPYSLTTSTL